MRLEIENGVSGMFFPLDQLVVANGGPLLVSRLFRPGRNFRVKNHRLALAVDPGTTGETVRLTSLLGRPERDGEMFPVHEVLAARVAPVHVSPLVAVGIMLVEDVVIPLVIDRPVGIVHPLCRRAEMVNRSSWVTFRLGNSRLHAAHGSVDGWIRGGVSLLRGDCQGEQDQEQMLRHGAHRNLSFHVFMDTEACRSILTNSLM